MRRIGRLLLAPFKMLYAKAWPVLYARSIGVSITGRVQIYGTSYGMFSAEPYLVTLGDNVHVTDGVRFICHDGGVLILRSAVPDLERAGRIRVGNNVFIGVGAIILPGVTIGNDCIIGAGSVVTRDVPDGSVAAGSPARVLKTIAEYFEKVQRDSLHIGHLHGKDKVKAYKRIFGVGL